MKINNIQNNNPKFGTQIGKKLQEKILLGKARDFFSGEQYENLMKIENNGLPGVLDIVDKMVIKRVNNKTSVVIEKQLALLNENKDKIIISNLSNVYKPRANNKFSFSFNRFAEFFKDNYNLAGKIEEAYKKFAEK